MHFARLAFTAVVVVGLAGVTSAGEVEIKGVHLCCGGCVKSVAKALGDVDGVSGANCDREAKIVTFDAADADAAGAGIEALAESGFFGTATHDGDDLAFPDSGAKEGAKANSISISNVHLCCGACVKAVAAAVKDIDGVSDAECDRKESTVTITGENVSVEAIVKALNDSGFNATVSE